MRDIKFRAWRKCEMYEGLDIEKLLTTTVKTGFDDTAISPVIWMQYTGLKDKNGVEIYEGDIVEITTIDNYTHQPISISKEIVSFNDNTARFDNATHFCGVSVIGNIHQNPELLGNQP